jgi:uncharacterized membrane protein HdeD (DUF308 family)
VVTVLNRILALSSFANILGGSVLVLTWAVNWASDPARHVPIIVFAIGAAMIVQGFSSAAYSLRWKDSWAQAAPRILLGWQLLLLCIGLFLLVAGFTTMPRSSHGDFEPAPILAGLMITLNALLALILLASSGSLTRTTRARGAA